MTEDPKPAQVPRRKATVIRGPASVSQSTCACGAKTIVRPRQRGVVRCSTCGAMRRL